MAQPESTNSLSRLLPLPILASVRVCGRSLKLSEFLEWTPGTILTFDQSASAPLTMHIGQREIGQGTAVQLGSQLGLRIQEMHRGSPVEGGAKAA